MKCLHHRSAPYLGKVNSGFTLPELLVIIVILGVIGAVGIGGFFFLVRRARVQSVALEVAGWLEQVRNAAADEVREESEEGGCQVTFENNVLQPAGQPIASADATCNVPDQDPSRTGRTLLVPREVQQDSVHLSVTGSNPFIFTPRGMWIDDDGDPGQDFRLTIRLGGADAVPVRCVRLSPALGSVQIGRPPNSADDTCTLWETL